MHPGYRRSGGARDTTGTVKVVDDASAKDPPEDVWVVLQHTGNAALDQPERVHRQSGGDLCNETLNSRRQKPLHQYSMFFDDFENTARPIFYSVVFGIDQFKI